MLYTLNYYNVICQLYLNKNGKRKICSFCMIWEGMKLDALLYPSQHLNLEVFIVLL